MPVGRFTSVHANRDKRDKSQREYSISVGLKWTFKAIQQYLPLILRYARSSIADTRVAGQNAPAVLQHSSALLLLPLLAQPTFTGGITYETRVIGKEMKTTKLDTK
jgi:hypothetical protein